MENLKKQAENDRSTIRLLQNRVFSLETEQNGKMNASKTPSSQEFSTYLLSMNHLIQNMAANDENYKNLTHQFDIAVNHFEEYKADMKTELDHYKQQLESERSKVSLLQNFTQHTDNNFNDFKTDILQMHVNQSTEMVGIKQQLESERSRVTLLQNVTQQTDEKVNDLRTDLLQRRLNQTNEMVDFKQQLENEKSKVYVLQNLTQRLNQRLNDLNVQIRYTSLSLLDLHTATEQLNGSLLQQLEERISDVHDLIIASMNAIKKRFTIS